MASTSSRWRRARRRVRRQHRRLQGHEARGRQEDRPERARPSSRTPATSTSRQDKARGRSGRTKLYEYRYTLQRLRREADARRRRPRRPRRPACSQSRTDEIETIDTSSTPAFLGLTLPAGYGSSSAGVSKAGEGIIIGIIDSGIWPETPSFADRTERLNSNAPRTGSSSTSRSRAGTASAPPARQFDASLCNQKLIGAQWFNAVVGRRRGHRRRAAVGVQLGPRLQRPRHAHLLDGGRQPRRPGHGPGGASSAPSAAWRRAPGSPCTRRSGPPRTPRRRAGRRPTSSPPSIRPSPTASTSSITRSAAR